MKPKQFLAVIGWLLFASHAGAALTTNSWTNSVSGKWEVAGNWSDGAPTNSNAANLITNAANKSVTIDATTAGTSTMTISNLIISAPLNSTNTLSLNNAGLATAFDILNSFNLTTNGMLSVANSILRVDGVSAGEFVIDAPVTLNSGSIISTNAAIKLANTANGTLATFGGSLLAGSVNIGVGANLQGRWLVGGGTNTLSGPLAIGTFGGGTGSVIVAIGQLSVTNASATALLGVSVGTLTVNGGNLIVDNLIGTNGTSAFDLAAGNIVSRSTSISNGFAINIARAGQSATLTLNDGTHTFGNNLVLGNFGGSTGAVWMTGTQLSVTNGTTTLGGVAGAVGQLTISNGMVRLRDVQIGIAANTDGTLTLAGGTNSLFSPFGSGDLTVGLGIVPGKGSVVVSGGQLLATNGTTTIGSLGTGQFTLSGGEARLQTLLVANSAGSVGTFTCSGGTNLITISTGIAQSAGSTGTVWITGGLFNPNAGFIFNVGTSGSGQLILSNGTLRCGQVTVAGNGGSAGTLTVNGGMLDGPGALNVAAAFNAIGTVWVTGGTVALTNNSLDNVIGNGGVGRMTVSNGLVLARQLNLGVGAGVGTLTMAGGTNNVYGGITLGNSVCTATGVVIVAGGELDVTNAAGSAVLEVRSGTFMLNSGTVRVDKFVLTNACANFVRTGGTLFYSTAVLNPARDDDGDGIPNAFDLDPLNADDAGADPDGDGFNNLQEYLAGTNPTNSASFFGITSIARLTNDIRVTWQTGLGKTNALERTAGAGGSFATNNFSAIFTVANTVGTSTNYLDLGAETNVPAFYYRVRLVP